MLLAPSLQDRRQSWGIERDKRSQIRRLSLILLIFAFPGNYSISEGQIFAENRRNRIFLQNWRIGSGQTCTFFTIPFANFRGNVMRTFLGNSDFYCPFMVLAEQWQCSLYANVLSVQSSVPTKFLHFLANGRVTKGWVPPFAKGSRRFSQTRSRTRLRIAASIAFLFRACFKGVLDTIAPLSRGWAPQAV